MSETIAIDMPDAVMDRFRRAAESAKRPVQELLVNALSNFAPKPPDGLPHEIRLELEGLESKSDQELQQVFDETMDAHSLSDYSEGDDGDRLMMRKAYAGVLLQWRGCELPELSTSKS